MVSLSQNELTLKVMGHICIIQDPNTIVPVSADVLVANDAVTLQDLDISRDILMITKPGASVTNAKSLLAKSF